MANVNIKVEVIKTKWWYIAILLSVLGFHRRALKIVDTKETVKIGKIG